MGAPHFRRVSAPELQNAGPELQLARAEVVALVANRIPRSRADDDQTVRNRVSSRITSDVNGGKLCSIRSGVFQLGDVVRWANARWPGCFTGLPMTPQRSGEDLTSNGEALSVLSALVVPGSLKECQKALRALSARLEEAEGELREARLEAERLRPKASSWDDWNKNKGRKRKL